MTNIKCTKENDRNNSALRTSNQHEQSKMTFLFCFVFCCFCLFVCLFIFVFVFVCLVFLLFCFCFCFCYFFAFQFSKRLRFVLCPPKWKLIYREKAFHAGKNIRKNDFASSEKFSCYASGLRSHFQFRKSDITW